MRVICARGPQGLWLVSCSTHGLLPCLWRDGTSATLGAMGHAAAHHAVPSR